MHTELVKYELRKIFSAAFIKMIAVILLLINIVMCIEYVSEYPSEKWNMYYESVYQLAINDPDKFLSEYERIDYEFSKEFLTTSIYGGGEVLDMQLFTNIYPIAMADKVYHDTLDTMLDQTERMRFNLERTGNTHGYAYRYQIRSAELYTYLNENVKLGNRPVKGWNEYFQYHTGYYFAFILISAICVYTVLNDRMSGFYHIASVCENGRGRTAGAKYIAAVIASVTVVAVLTILSFLTVGVMCGGYSDITNAAQAVKALQLLPVRVNMLGALLLDMFFKCVSAFIFCTAVFLITVIIKNMLVGFCAGVGIMALNYYISCIKSLSFVHLKHLNLWSIYNLNQFYSRYRSIDLFGYPIGLTEITVVIAVLLSVICVVLSVTFFSGDGIFSRMGWSISFDRALGKFASSLDRIKRGKKRHNFTSGAMYEIYKNRAIYLVLLVFVLLKAYTANNYYQHTVTIYEKQYKEYLEKIGGTYSQDKAEYINKEFDKCDKIIRDFEAIEKRFWAGEMSSSAFSYYAHEYMNASGKISVLDDLKETTDYLDALYETRGILGSYIFDQGYGKLVGQGVDWLLLVILCVLSSRLYLIEYSHTRDGSSMLALVNATERGQIYLYRVKLRLCVLTASATWCIFKATDFICLLHSYDLPDMNAAVVSMPKYEGFAINVSVGNYLIISNVLSLIGTVMAAIFFFMLSIILERAMLAYSIAAVVLLVPYYVSGIGAYVSSYFDITMLNNTDRLIMLSIGGLPTPMGAIIFILVSSAVIALMNFAASHKIKRGSH